MKRIILLVSVCMLALTSIGTGQAIGSQSPPTSDRGSDYKLKTLRPGEVSSLSTPRKVTTRDQKVLGETADTPNFAGLYLERDGTPVVLVAGGARERAAASVAPILKNVQALDKKLSPRLAAGKYKVRSVKFRFRDLQTWMTGYLSKAPSAHRALTVDVSERHNKLIIKTDSRQSQDQAISDAKGLGIPRDAVSVTVGERIVSTATLRDRTRPLAGGLEIYLDEGGICTLGSVVRISGLSNQFFTTADHCSKTMGSTSSENVYQNQVISESNYIGWEWRDPPFFSKSSNGLCPSTTPRCRYSDVVVGAISSTVTGAWGVQWRTTFRSTDMYAGSITRTTPVYITMDGKSGSFWEGEEVHKIGRTTGWTYGYIDEIGAIINYVDPNGILGRVWFIGSHHVKGMRCDEGDSGSTTWLLGSDGRRFTNGTVSARDTTGCWFSPWWAAEQELGVTLNLG